jgi:hypothetical protein
MSLATNNNNTKPDINKTIVEEYLKPEYEDVDEEQGLLFNTLELLLRKPARMAKESDVISAAEGVCEAYVSYQYSMEKPSTMLSVEQTEKLLEMVAPIEFKNKYRLNNALVAMCKLPWGVSVCLGGSGVCYYGNFGEMPHTLKIAIDILHKNHLSLMQKGHIL